MKCIYLGIIYFSSKIKSGKFPEWEGTESLSTLLGYNKYPLFKFCYDYIRWQKIEVENISKAKDDYDKMKLYNENADRDDIDLQKLYTYYERTESEVKEVLKSIEKRLKNPENIGFYSYGRLAEYLIKVSHVIDFDYTQCKEYMIKNIEGKRKNIDSHLLFLPRYAGLEQDEKDEFKNFVEQLSESMNMDDQVYFSYNPVDIQDLYDSVLKDIPIIKDNHQFISKYNAAQLVEMIFHSSSEQIMKFRSILFAVYRHASKADFIESDKNTMEEILKLVQKKLDPDSYKEYGIDKIQLLQLEYLRDNLNTFITQMS